MCNARCAGKVPCDQSFRCNAGAAAVTGCDLAMTVTPHGVPEHSVNSGPQLRLQTVAMANDVADVQPAVNRQPRSPLEELVEQRSL